jgi:hypothetical protein
MSTCIRGGQIYKRHLYKGAEVCKRCDYTKGGQRGNQEEQENSVEESGQDKQEVALSTENLD